jgi:Flp pilus assembly protein TadD
MKTNYQDLNKLNYLCLEVKDLIKEEKYKKSVEVICDAMKENPNAPEPHNLLGIIFEQIGDHNMAMRHFRAAYALDPSYKPASENLTTYGTFDSLGKFSIGKFSYGDD